MPLPDARRPLGMGATSVAASSGPPTIALKGLVHNPDKIGRSKGPRADFIRTKWPKIGGRGGRKIRTNQDGGAGGLVHLPREAAGRAAAGGGSTRGILEATGRWRDL